MEETLLLSKQNPAYEAWHDFLATPYQIRLQRLQTVSPEAHVLALFQSVAKTVPAYQAFLSVHGINPQAVSTWRAFQQLPLLTKQNYIQQYPLADRCRQGVLQACDMIAVSSGSTGKPTFWPRTLADELEIATRFEQIFVDSFQADKRSTLAVICFALGTWVGGMYSTNCCRYLGAKGYPITVVTPGNNIMEIFRVVQDLAPQFQQVVLLGYPPFLKEVIDQGCLQGIDWPAYRIKFVLAGEVFSEEWRTLVAERVAATDPCYDFASLYGTADAGVLGNETPLSIAIRRFLATQPDAARQLFGESRLPTLVQYDPLSRFFEVHEGTLLFSGNNGVPLIRYHIADVGGIISYTQMLDSLAQWGFHPLQQLKGTAYPLPFVYVFGRSQFTVSYFGANVYPENISIGLEQPAVQAWVTGKFVLEVKEDVDKNVYLSVIIELAPGVSADVQKERALAETIRTQLIRLNSEFAHYVPPAYQTPRIHLLPAGHPEYFPPGVKHRYTRPPQFPKR